MGKEFKLNHSDVSIAGGHSTTGRSKVRLSRALAVTASHFTFTHQPTGVKVSGRVLPGHYSRKELSRLNQKLCEKYIRLEYEVAKALRATGRKAITLASDPDEGFFEIKSGEFSVAELLGVTKERSRQVRLTTTCTGALQACFSTSAHCTMPRSVICGVRPSRWREGDGT